jgi:hypothetical protein
VTVNGSSPQWFILDTGCSGGSVIAAECADRLRLRRGGEAREHVGAGTGVSVGVAGTPDVTLGIAGVTMHADSLSVFSLAHVAPFEGRRVDGLLGEDFLQRHVVEIDYRRQRVRFLDPDTFVPAPRGIVVPITIEYGLAVARATMVPRGGQAIPCRLVIDTGVRATVIFYRPFSLAHQLLGLPGNLQNATTGGGVGGDTRGDVGRLERLDIGAFAFASPTALFARDTVGVFAGLYPDGIVGGELLRRARVTFDYPHRRLILEPDTDTPSPFEYDMSGVFLIADGSDFRRLVVRSVTAGTPAAECGLEPGDEIIAIEDRRAPELTLESARAMFRREGRYRLELRRHGEPLQVTLATRRLV